MSNEERGARSLTSVAKYLSQWQYSLRADVERGGACKFYESYYTASDAIIGFRSPAQLRSNLPVLNGITLRSLKKGYE